jgi:hypothetical protein
MSSERTGIARGSLRPVIYFENKDHYVIIPPEEVGVVGIARKVYEEKYKALGWEWREASTLHEVDKLQKRLVDQEVRRNSAMADRNSECRDRAFHYSGQILRQRMCSSSTTPWERDFIAAYLKMREDKRDRYRDALTHHNYYLYARENDENKKIDLPLQEGQFERSGV